MAMESLRREGALKLQPAKTFNVPQPKRWCDTHNN